MKSKLITMAVVIASPFYMSNQLQRSYERNLRAYADVVADTNRDGIVSDDEKKERFRSSSIPFDNSVELNVEQLQRYLGLEVR